MKTNMNMKKMVFSIMMMVFAISASAQHEAGKLTIQPKIGVNGSIFYMDDKNVKNENFGGLSAGVELEYQIKKWFSLSAGALYSQEGGKVKVKDINITEKVKADYINIPVLANFYVWKGLALKVGVQPSFKVNDKFEVPNSTVLATSKYSFGDEMKGFDLKMPIGISYDFGGLVLELRSAVGTIKPFKDRDYQNACATFSVGYKFSLK